MPATRYAIIPKPYSITPAEGAFALNSETCIVVSPATQKLGLHLQGELERPTSWTLALTQDPRPNSISLLLDESTHDVGCEGYILETSAHGVSIRSPRKAGLFYGIQTLKQLLPAAVFRQAEVADAQWSVPCGTVVDHPRFPWRGVHVDVSRHFMPKSWLLKFVDVMALHKLNILHLHLTDNNGWRMEIKRYPELGERGSRTDFSEMNPGTATRSVSQPPGGYYTQDDLREIVAYAADRYVTVVPEIEMPGHSLAPIQVFPHLGNAVQIREAGGDLAFLGKSPCDDVFNVEPETIEFLQNVLDEVLDVFPSPFIHVGGDEVWKEPWKRNPKAQARMKELGLQDEDELQSWFIRQMDGYLTQKGRRLIGWDEILEGGLAPGATVMSWRGEEGGIAAAQAGHDVVMSPGSHTYLDHYQSRLRYREPLAIGGFTSLQKAYSYEPVPAALTNIEAIHVMGAQFQLWSEWMPHAAHMEYMAYPRGCALAEVFWSMPDGRDFAEFEGRLRTHLERMTVLDVHFRKLQPEPEPVGTWQIGEGGEAHVSIEIAGPVGGRMVAAFVPPHGAPDFRVTGICLYGGGRAAARGNDLGPIANMQRGAESVLEAPMGLVGPFRLDATIALIDGKELSGEVFFFSEPLS